MTDEHFSTQDEFFAAYAGIRTALAADTTLYDEAVAIFTRVVEPMLARAREAAAEEVAVCIEESHYSHEVDRRPDSTCVGLCIAADVARARAAANSNANGGS